jgi:transcriptional regulator with XRE-family HTH domain
MQRKTIRQLREERNWTQQDLAVKLGVSLATVYNWERGKYEPRASQFRALGLAFGVPMESIDLVTEDEGKAAA